MAILKEPQIGGIMAEWNRISEWLSQQRGEMIELQRSLTAIPALAPENGGEGEGRKAGFLSSWLREKGFPGVKEYSVPDERVPGGKRPVVVTELAGENEGPAIWVMSHLDIVPPGEEVLWEGDPYILREKEGRIYGRGVEDNQQGMVASIFAMYALLKAGITPPKPIKLLFVPDEEVGSQYGIQYILKELDLFSPGDTFLVPDGGNPEGTMLEIAEKSVLWLEFTTHGRQCHASMPQLGINAFLAASELVVLLGGLKEVFSNENTLFDPPYSTFVPTKKKANVPNVNTLPGEDVFCLDCRILPEVPLQDVLNKVDSYSRSIEEKHGVTIERRILQRVESEPTPHDSPFVQEVSRAIETVHGVPGVPTGIGGGTVGAYLRNAGFHTVVWATIDETAHMPNEYCVLDNLLKDSRIMANLFLRAVPD